MYKRYKYGCILGILMAFYLLSFLFGIVIILISPVVNKELSLHEMFNININILINLACSLSFFSLLFYYLLNDFYERIASRRGFIHYGKPIIISLSLLALYQSVMFFLLNKNNLVLSVNEEVNKNLVPVGLIIISYLITATLAIGISWVIAYLTYLRDERQRGKLVEKQKIQLEIEKTQANYNFLKAQINPHFLHNTLSFLYVKSLSNSPILPEAILTLSDIMRYALNEGNVKDGKAYLKDEIEHLRNVIKINQLRFGNSLNVQLTVEGIINGLQIIPFVLITLVENAFKHGDLANGKHPITFDIQIHDDTFYFYSRNKKKTGPKELSTGIGLDNIKKRLDLMYGDLYTFNIIDQGEFYTTELTIDSL